MKVKRNTLLLIACLVWCAAGFNIFRIGYLAYQSYVTTWNLLMSGVGEILCHYVLYDGRRNWYPGIRISPGALHCCILFRSGSLSFIGGNFIWP